MTGFNLSALAVRERAVTLFLILAVAIAGVYAFLKLGRAEDPSFTVKVLTVTAAWPGATAQEMQDLVAEPLEKRLQELRWYDRVETMTRPGLAFMTAHAEGLHAAGRGSRASSTRRARSWVTRRATCRRAPSAPSSTTNTPTSPSRSMPSKAPGMPPRLLVRQAETLRQRLLHVAGVKKVNILGERPERIFVEFSYAAPGDARHQRAGHLRPRCRARTPSRRRGRSTPADRRSSSVSTAPMTISRRSRDTPIVAGGRNLKLSDVAEVRPRLRGSRDLPDPPPGRAGAHARRRHAGGLERARPRRGARGRDEGHRGQPAARRHA